ncbi:MAG: hypothetical protein JXX14_18200 [Deltaproteobacteria bacterium]|nr:hypothetical protein [Deltaproteobacteria bacterium]
MTLVYILLAGVFIATGCGDSGHTDTATDAPTDTASETVTATETDNGVCTDMCNAITAADPIVDQNKTTGSVTTYGSPDDPEYSVGGACNYGQTQLQNYAAIHVHISAADSDFLGPWDNGHACGGCMKVRTQTAAGWLETTVRITDRCADQYCGIDLGGAPAADVMPLGPGRYQGEWEWVSCEGHTELFDGPTAIYVKDGANPYWSIIQVRNPLSQVTGMSIRKNAESGYVPLAWAAEGDIYYAENFYVVPPEILQDAATYTIRINYALSEPHIISCKGSDLAIPEAIYPVPSS